MAEEGQSPDHQDIETIHGMASESSEFFKDLAQALERLKELFVRSNAVSA